MITKPHFHFMTLNRVHADGPLIGREQGGINSRNNPPKIYIPVGQIKLQIRVMS